MNLSEDIFRSCFLRYASTFADGQRANNKFDTDYIKSDRRLHEPVGRAAASLAAVYYPDLVVAVPNGANWFGIDLAWRLGTAVLLLDMDRKTKQITFREGGQEQLEAANRVVVAEDVPNRRTTSAKLLALPGMAERAVAEVAIFDRGIPEEKVDLSIPVEAIFTLPIAAMLPPDSQLWDFARNRHH